MPGHRNGGSLQSGPVPCTWNHTSKPTTSFPGTASPHKRSPPMKISGWKASVLIALVGSFLPAHARAAQQTTGSLATGTGIYAELNGGIDSKKAKAGDGFTLHTTEAVKASDDRIILPKDTKVVGHVTQSEAKSKGANESTLGLAFDKAVLGRLPSRCPWPQQTWMSRRICPQARKP